MIKEFRERFKEVYDICLQVPGKNLAFEDWLLPLVEQEIIEAERRMKERCLKASEYRELTPELQKALTQKGIDYENGRRSQVKETITAISSLK